MSKYNVTQNQSESVNTNTQIINTVREPETVAYKEKTKADKLVNNLNNLFNTGAKVLQVASQVQTENAFENANRKILSKNGNLSNTQIEKLNQEVSEEAGIFANVDKVGKKINSKLSVENATFDFTNLKNNVDSNWEHMSNEKKKEFAGKSDYFNSVFNEYNQQSLSENTEVDTDYALKYANNLNSFKNKTLLSYMAEDAQTKEKEQDFKSNATHTNTAYVNSKHNYINKDTGNLESVGEDNKKVLFRQLKDELSLNGNSSDRQIKMLNNIKEVAIQNNNEDLLDSVYNSELLSEDVKKNVRVDVEKAKIKIRSNLTREQLRISKANKDKNKVDTFLNEEKVIKESNDYLLSGRSEEEYLEYANSQGVNLKIASKEYKKNKTILDTHFSVEEENKSYKEVAAANPEKAKLINMESKKAGQSIYNNILSDIIKLSNKEYTDEEIIYGKKEEDTLKLNKEFEDFSKRASIEDSDKYLEYAKIQSQKIYNYGEQQVTDMTVNQLEQTQLVFNMNNKLMKSGVNILNNEQKLEHNLANYFMNDLNVNSEDRNEQFRQALIFSTKIRNLDKDVRNKATIENNKTNNKDFTDFLDTLTDSNVRKEAKILGDSLTALTGKKIDIEQFKDKFLKSSNIQTIELDGSDWLNDNDINIDLSDTFVSSQEDYNNLVVEARDKGILGDEEYFATQRIGNKNIFYIINEDNNNILGIFGSKKFTNEELLEKMGRK